MAAGLVEFEGDRSFKILHAAYDAAVHVESPELIRFVEYDVCIHVQYDVLAMPEAQWRFFKISSPSNVQSLARDVLVKNALEKKPCHQIYLSDVTLGAILGWIASGGACAEFLGD